MQHPVNRHEHVGLTAATACRSLQHLFSFVPQGQLPEVPRCAQHPVVNSTPVAGQVGGANQQAQQQQRQGTDFVAARRYLPAETQTFVWDYPGAAAAATHAHDSKDDCEYDADAAREIHEDAYDYELQEVLAQSREQFVLEELQRKSAEALPMLAQNGKRIVWQGETYLSELITVAGLYGPPLHRNTWFDMALQRVRFARLEVITSAICNQNLPIP